MRNEIFTVIDDLTVNITNIEGKTIDVSRMMLTVEFFESIFEFFISGKLVLADTLDLPQNFPIVGGESIEFIINTTDSPKTLNLKHIIYKIEKDTFNTRGDAKRKSLVIYFCSEECIEDSKKRISKKFNGTGDSIVGDLIKSHLNSKKTISSDSSIESVEVFSNFWNVSRIIDFVSKISKTSKYSDYIFFENFSGFVFRPISAILNEDPLYNISYNTSPGSFIGNNNIKIFTFNKYFDILLNSKTAAFGTTFFKPNDTEYSYLKTTGAINEVIEEIITNGSSLFFNEDLLSTENFIAPNYYKPEISRIRTLSLKLFENYNISIKLNGDFSRMVGDSVSIDFPNYDNESVVNSQFNGNWLILGIKHIITQNNNFEQNVLLGKNAFFNMKQLKKIQALKKI